MSGIEGKAVAITGGGGGIGEARALLLAERGAKVVLGARRPERLEDLALRIEKNGGEAAWVRTDVTRREDVAGLVAFLLAHLEQLGVVGQLARELVERDDHAAERLLLLAQLLGLFRVVPDRRVFQRCVYRAQAFELGIEVKDTSVALACAERGLRGWCR